MPFTPTTHEVGTATSYSMAGTVVAALNPSGGQCWIINWYCSDGFALGRVDEADGTFTQLSVPFTAGEEDTGAMAAVYNPTDEATYLIGMPHIHLFRIADSGTTVQDLGRLTYLSADTYAGRACVSSTGIVYWGMATDYANLCSYDPATGVQTNHGHASATNKYCYPYMNADDTVVCLLSYGAIDYCTVYDPVADTFTDLAITVSRPDEIICHECVDGYVYITTYTAATGTLTHYKVSGTTVTPSATIPAFKRSYVHSDGTSFRWGDLEDWEYQDFVKIDPDGAETTFRLNYTSGGADIYSMHMGPDGLIYNSTRYPDMLSTLDPMTDTIVKYGRAAQAEGHIYDWVNYGDLIYWVSYSLGYVTKYDTMLGYLGFGTNPLSLGRASTKMYRPYCAILVEGTPDKIYITGRNVPGIVDDNVLVEYNLSTGVFTTYNPTSIDYMAMCDLGDGTILIGTTTDNSTAAKALLLVWDTTTNTLTKTVTPTPTFRFMPAMCKIGSKVYIFGSGVTIATDSLMIFDITSKTIDQYVDVPAVTPSAPVRAILRGLQADAMGNLVMTTEVGVYRLGLQSLTWTLYHVDSIYAAGPITNNKLHFGLGTKLKYVAYPGGFSGAETLSLAGSRRRILTLTGE